MAKTMEKLEQIQQTLSHIDDRVPDALRVALGLGHRVSPTPGPGESDDVADFAASLLQPPATEGDDRGPTEPDAMASAPRMELGSCYLPLHDHDAHFVDAKAGVFGVADGVGAYAEDPGVDAGAFSRGLMTSASAEVAAGSEPGAHVCPYALLERAYDMTAASGASGASTAAILSLAGDALEWAYIGDSTFAVLRGGKILFLSTPQRHLSRTSRGKLRFCPTASRRRHLFSFNDPPFQLGANAKHSDRVSDALVGQVAVSAGDVVVVGTDGLFDNMLDEQLELAVQMGTKLGMSPKEMADVIAGVAYERSNQTSSKRLRRGKPDDITVLVAFIVQSDSSCN